MPGRVSAEDSSSAGTLVTTNRRCLSSDQVVASAAVRFAGCSKATNSWSKGGR